MAPREIFSSYWAVILAGLGMAVGTGNMWRFPRIAAQNGGAAFLILWFIFLFIWSIPLLIAELSIGRTTRRGTMGSFARLVGDRFAWMGGFVAVVTIMILFYYSVVTGWTLKYVVASITGQLHGVDPAKYWESYAASIWQPIFFHRGVECILKLREDYPGADNPRSADVDDSVTFFLEKLGVRRSGE